MRRLLLLLLLLFNSSVIAGGRGGHNTVFDANLLGGGWTCFRSAASGTCGFATTNYFNAACDGATDDSSALSAFVTYGVAQNPGLVKLYIPSGSRCTFTTFFNGSTSPTGTAGSTPIQNVIIWGYGATVSNWGFGNFSYRQDYTHSARINTVSAGATTVVVNDGNIGRFAVGDWISATGLSMQVNSYPPNFNFFEHRVITAINGNTVTINAPLDNSYLSTWPVIDPSHTQPIDEGGPATIYVLDPSWNANVATYGLTTNAVAPVVTGRNTVLYDVTYVGTASGLNFSAGLNLWAFYSTIGPSVEIDKLTTNLNIVRSSGGAFVVQSSSTTNLIFDSVTATNSVGTSVNTTIRNSKVAIVAVGAGFFGHSVNVTADGSTITTTQPGYVLLDKTLVSYSSSSFTIANSSAGPVWQWAVPGQKYFFGYSPGFSPGATCNAGVSFTVTGLSQDASNTIVATDLVGALPSPSCNGNTYNAYVNYGAALVSQKFSGPADLTQYAAP